MQIVHGLIKDVFIPLSVYPAYLRDLSSDGEMAMLHPACVNARTGRQQSRVDAAWWFLVSSFLVIRYVNNVGGWSNEPGCNVQEPNRRGYSVSNP